MNRAIAQFRTNMESAKQLGVIYQAFENKISGALPLDELLRAEIVLAVSALDCYVHDIVRIRIRDILCSKSGEEKSLKNLSINLDGVLRVLRESSIEVQADLFEQEVRRSLGFKTYQKANAISEALSLIGIRKVWEKISCSIGKSSKDIQAELDLIVDRRNKIAHEGDIDPSVGFALKFPIDFTMVHGTVAFLENVATEIHSVIIKESSS